MFQTLQYDSMFCAFYTCYPYCYRIKFVPRCTAIFYKVAKTEEGRKMGDRGGDIKKDVMENKSVVHNFLKSFPN